ALVDRPFDQRRDVRMAELDGASGHVAVVGATQSGKTNTLRTLIAGLALAHTPDEVQFYLLDFGGGGLAALAQPAHVGSVAQRREPERVVRTVAEVAEIVNRREVFFGANGIESMAEYRRLRRAGRFAEEPHGDVFLVIDGWFTLHQDYEAVEATLQ